MKNLGLQLYTIRDYMKTEKDINESFAKIVALGYTEAHTAGTTVPVDIFARAAKKNGLRIIGTHYDYNKIINSPGETMQVHDMWGTKNVGIGGMPSEARKSYDALMAFIETFNKTAEKYAKQGYKLTYHNHSFEFLRINGNKTMMDYLYEELDPKNISFVLDTCWVANAGADVCYWMEKLAGRIDILHLKDVKIIMDENKKLKNRVAEIGNGNIWWDGVMATAEKIGVKNYVVEQDDGFINDDAFESVKASADFLKKYMD